MLDGVARRLIGPPVEKLGQKLAAATLLFAFYANELSRLRGDGGEACVRPTQL